VTIKLKGDGFPWKMQFFEHFNNKNTSLDIGKTRTRVIGGYYSLGYL
jgi:hypothetical protein